MKRTKYSRIGFAFGTVFLGALTGCVHEARHARASARPPPDYVEANVVVQDDYIYYPGYQVYYSSNRRQYIYLEDRLWVTRPAPPRVSAAVLIASPSVRLAFHDAPSFHHATIVRQYPRHWSPPGPGPNHDPGNRDDGNRINRGGRR